MCGGIGILMDEVSIVCGLLYLTLPRGADCGASDVGVGTPVAS